MGWRGERAEGVLNGHVFAIGCDAGSGEALLSGKLARLRRSHRCMIGELTLDILIGWRMFTSSRTCGACRGVPCRGRQIWHAVSIAND